MRVGLIGTGVMGNRIGAKLLHGGHSLAVYDVRRESTLALCQAGAEWREGPLALAESCDAVMTSLPDPGIVRNVVLDGENGVLRVMKPGRAFIDISTATPSLAQEIAAAAKIAGVDALDAPLSSGGVYIGVGGERQAYERWLPLLRVAGDHVFYVGEAGMGQAAKLVRQYLAFSIWMAELETLVMADKAGLDMSTMVGFLRASIGGLFPERTVSRLMARDFGSPGQSSGTLDIVSKDVRLAVEFARRLNAPASLGLAASDILQRGQAQGLGRHEFWAAVQVLEQLSGARVEGQLTAVDLDAAG